MMEITVNTRLKDILNLPELAECKEYLFWMDGISGWPVLQGRMSQFDVSWNAESMCRGFERLREISRTGRRICYPLYDVMRVGLKPELRQQAMLHFSIERRAKFAVVCAGGGYGAVCSMVEAFPTARILNELGYHVFVVNYRVGKAAKAPNPQDDLALAIRYILDHAGELNVRKEDYAVVGFSAGGHLVGCYGTERLGYPVYDLPRPAALFLAYPVVTMGEKTHAGSRENLLGRERMRSEEWIQRYSVEKQVTRNYPPSFIWQCAQDREVPIENTQLLVKALEKAGVDYCYRTYPGDAHGWGCGDGTAAEGWLRQAVQFWEEQC